MASNNSFFTSAVFTTERLMVLQAEKRLKEESERVHAYLDRVSEEKLLKECEQQLLANHQTALLDKEETGCRALLREGKTEGEIV